MVGQIVVLSDQPLEPPASPLSINAYYHLQAMFGGFFSSQGDEPRDMEFFQANSPKRAQQLVQILTDLGPTFIKIGQAQGGFPQPKMEGSDCQRSERFTTQDGMVPI